MEALERENAARVRRGVAPRQLHSSWVNRPRLNPGESALFAEFHRFASFAGNQSRAADALAWFEMRNVSHAERPWMAELFAAMSSVLRETVTDE